MNVYVYVCMCVCVNFIKNKEFFTARPAVQEMLTKIPQVGLSVLHMRSREVSPPQPGKVEERARVPDICAGGVRVWEAKMYLRWTAGELVLAAAFAHRHTTFTQRIFKKWI